MLLDKLFDGFDEVPRQGLDCIGGGDFGLPLLPDESQSSFDDLQAWNDGVQVHPVDGLDLQSDVLAQHLSDSLW